MRGTLGLPALALALQPAPTLPPTHITGKIEILDKGEVKRKVIQDVVVFVDGIKAPVPNALRTERAIIASQDRSFVPHVEAVPVGSTVTFPNMDDIMHNVFSISRGNQFDLGGEAYQAIVVPIQLLEGELVGGGTPGNQGTAVTKDGPVTSPTTDCDTATPAGKP